MYEITEHFLSIAGRGGSNDPFGPETCKSSTLGDRFIVYLACSVFLIKECTRIHIIACQYSKFSGGGPPDPLPVFKIKERMRASQFSKQF